MKTKDAYTELAVQIAQLTAKVDKLLELAMKPKWTALDHERGPARTSPTNEEREADVPPQWSNESHTDYLKRIGQYNEALSDYDQTKPYGFTHENIK